MKVVIVPDKFKGSATSYEVCQALAHGMKETGGDLELCPIPIADGGDGSLAVLSHFGKGDWIQCDGILDPLGRPRSCAYWRNDKTAYIEMARASGIALLAPHELAPMRADTRGTGQLIHHAMDTGCLDIYLFVGGSCSTDGGLGALSQIGFDFIDHAGNTLKSFGGEMLQDISKINKSSTTLKRDQINLHVVCDVQNPFFGKEGSAHIYAAQKGANKDQIAALDRGLNHFAELIKNQFKIDIQDVPGSGAAGGIAGGLLGIADAQIISGTQFFIQVTQLISQIQSADLIVTGEGKIDDQTFYGKIVGEIIHHALASQKRLILVCGSNALKHYPTGVEAIYQLIDYAESADKAIAEPLPHLEAVGRRIISSQSGH